MRIRGTPTPATALGDLRARREGDEVPDPSAIAVEGVIRG